MTDTFDRVLDAYAGIRTPKPEVAESAAPKPSNMEDRGQNPLRPRFLDDMIGQYTMRNLMKRVIDASLLRDVPLDHLLLVGGSGTGKSTMANIVANELCVDTYQVEAPISQAALLELREVMTDGDVLFIDEIHQQAASVRGAKDSTTQPEVLFSVMEDRVIVSADGVLPFPAITVIGATTDEGLLPEPFLNRFPLRPAFAPYTLADLTQIAHHNGDALGLDLTDKAAERFARASRHTPRMVNNYVKNAASLVGADGRVTGKMAREVLEDLNGVTEDGLTRDMQNMLTFMLDYCKRTAKDGDTTYKASLSTIASSIGKGRDQQAIKLRVEPYLLASGWVQITNGGRQLTDAGVRRAQVLP